jgi:hypothetical protein
LLQQAPELTEAPDFCLQEFFVLDPCMLNNCCVLQLGDGAPHGFQDGMHSFGLADLAGSAEVEQFVGGPADEIPDLAILDYFLVEMVNFWQFHVIFCSQFFPAGEFV